MGPIIGIVSGIVVLIIVVITIVCLCKKRRKITSFPKDDIIDINQSNSSINKSSVSITKEDDQEKKEEKKNQITIINFITISQFQIQVSIDPNKTMGELFKKYFKIIKRPELLDDETIRFMKNGKFIPQNSTDLVKNYLKRKEDGNIIIIDDVENKIKSTFIN